MARVGAFAIALCLAVAAMGATAYDDFTSGLNAVNRGDADAAIAAFTRALAAGDLAPGYVPTARIDRARAYMRKGKCTDALADADEVVKIDARNVDAHMLRGAAHTCLKQNDEAVADFDQAVRLRPTAALYEETARYEWSFGRFADAAANYAHAVALSSKTNPHLPYMVLWHAMTADRAGTLDQAALAEEMRDIDDDDWPGPLIMLYRGKLTVERAAAKAAARDPQKATEQKCEADFYVGEWQLARANRDAALTLLKQAVDECPHNFVEFFAAQEELKRQS